MTGESGESVPAWQVVFNDEHTVTAEPIHKMAGVIGWRFSCSCGRIGNGRHDSPKKAVDAGKGHIGRPS